MGQVSGPRGGYDGRSENGQNTKDEIERKTPKRNWEQDTSVFAGYKREIKRAKPGSLHDKIIEEEQANIFREVAKQDEEAEKARKTFKRTTRVTFADRLYED